MTSLDPLPLIAGNGSWQGFLLPGGAVGTSTDSRRIIKGRPFQG
jgi:hypothetical protein